MIEIAGPGVRLCDRMPRRALIQAGSIGALGFGLSDHFAARASGRDKDLNCILLWLWGAPSHVDTWDMKPDQSEEIRGMWKPISTGVPGMEVCEHLPRFARQMKRITQVRTMFNEAPDHPEGAAIALSGFKFIPGKPDKEGPHVGSVVSKFGKPKSNLPQYVVLGRELWDNGARVPGQYGGFLGGAYGPFRVEDPRQGVDRLPSIQLPTGVTPERLGRRNLVRGQLDHFDQHVQNRDLRSYDESVQKALNLLTSAGVKQAFDLSQEPESLRARYGMSFFGQSCMAARRLVEHGVRYVQVNWSRHPGADGLEGWDVHGNFGGFLTDYPKKQFPAFDQSVPALLDDLEARGLLENTLVILATEFGRSPKINKWGGRDHWPNCYTVMFAGAGVEGGRVIGESDAQGAYPETVGFHTRNMLMSVYQHLGLDTGLALRDAGIVAQDAPIPGLFGNRG